VFKDKLVQAAHVEHAPESELGASPPWHVARIRGLGERDGAVIGIVGDPHPRAFESLDERRVGLYRPRELQETRLRALLVDNINWTLAGVPTTGWAEVVFGEPDADRLWDAVATTVRLDEPDPVAAWRYRGPGTDLTVGLLPGTVWRYGRAESAGGRTFVPNMPTIARDAGRRRGGHSRARSGRDPP
jgi:aminopeptidase